MVSMEDMNNFHGYFPGGHIRRRREAGESSGMDEAVMRDLDTLLEGSGFDVNFILQERRLWHGLVRTVQELTRGGASLTDVEAIGLESEAHCKRVQEMIYPFFLKMLEKGYKRNELTA